MKQWKKIGSVCLSLLMALTVLPAGGTDIAQSWDGLAEDWDSVSEEAWEESWAEEESEGETEDAGLSEEDSLLFLEQAQEAEAEPVLPPEPALAAEDGFWEGEEEAFMDLVAAEEEVAFRVQDVEGGVQILRAPEEEYGELVIPSEIEGKPVVSIASRAFAGVSVVKLVLPASLRSLEEGALQMESLSYIEVEEGSPAFRSADGVLFDITGEMLLRYPFDKGERFYRVPEGVKSIAALAFEGIYQLIDVVVPASVESIGAEAMDSFYSVPRRLWFEGEVPDFPDDLFDSYGQRTIYFPQGKEAWKAREAAYQGYAKITWREALPAPVLLAPAQKEAGVEVSWEEVPGAAGYQVLKCRENTFWWEIGTSETGSFLDTDVYEGETYFYTVRALGEEGEILSLYEEPGQSITVTKPTPTPTFTPTPTNTPSPTPTPSITPIPTQAPAGVALTKVKMTFGQTEARGMLDLINKFRTGGNPWAWDVNGNKVVYRGLAPLHYDYVLEEAAMARAAELAQGYFSHTRPNGMSCFTAAGGYYQRTSGENIAYGYGTAEAVFIGWREDDEDYYGQGHRRNMLNPNFTAVGIGHAIGDDGVHYWVQQFSGVEVVPEKTKAVDGTAAVYCAMPDIYMTPLKATLYVGDVASGQKKLQLQGANLGVSGTVKFQSSDKSVATVSSKGVIKAKTKGKAKITASLTYEGRTYQKTCQVTVKEPSFKLKASKLTLRVGECANVSLKTLLPQGKIKWKSNNTKKVKVSSTGLIVGVAAGSTNVTATANGITRKVKVTVKK